MSIKKRRLLSWVLIWTLTLSLINPGMINVAEAVQPDLAPVENLRVKTDSYRVGREAEYANYEVSFITSEHGGLEYGDMINVIFPAEYNFSNFIEYDVELWVEGEPEPWIHGEELYVQVFEDTEINAWIIAISIMYETLSIAAQTAVTIDLYDLINPETKGEYTIGVETTLDSIPAETSVYIYDPGNLEGIWELPLGYRVVDNSRVWEHKIGNNYSDTGAIYPVKWIIVDKQEDGITLLAEELIGKYAFDDHGDNGRNRWDESGTPDAAHGLRPFLNSLDKDGDPPYSYEGEGFYSSLSDAFRSVILQTELVNKDWETGDLYYTNDYVFIPSLSEIGLPGETGTYDIGAVWQYFDGVDRNTRKAFLDEDPNPGYWTRSPVDDYSHQLKYIDAFGNPGTSTASTGSRGVRPALRVNVDTPIIEHENGLYNIMIPSVDGLSVDPDNHRYSTTGEEDVVCSVYMFTSFVSEETTINVEFLDEDKNSFDPPVVGTGVVAGGQGNIQLTIPWTMPVGDYWIEVSIPDYELHSYHPYEIWEPEIESVALTYTADTGGTIDGDTSQTVNHGSDGTEVTAVADTGYHFVDWSDGVTTPSRTDTGVTGDINVTANFAETTVTFNPVGSLIWGRSHSTEVTIDSGSVTTDNEYQWTTSPEFPTEGIWIFFNSGDAIEAPPEASGVYYLHVYVTHSEDSINIIEASSNAFNLDNTLPEIMFDPDGSEAYEPEHTTTVTVTDEYSGINTAELKYQWTTTETFPEEDTWELLVTDTLTTPAGIHGAVYLHVTATDNVGNITEKTSLPFNIVLENTLTVTSTDGGSVTLPGEGTFNRSDGNTEDIEASAETGYEFVNWTTTAGTIGDANSAITTFSMPSEDATLTANFEIIEELPAEYPATGFYVLSESGNLFVDFYSYIENTDDARFIVSGADPNHVMLVHQDDRATTLADNVFITLTEVDFGPFLEKEYIRLHNGQPFLLSANSAVDAPLSDIAEIEKVYAICGDANGDGILTVKDAILVLRHITGIAQLDDYGIKRAGGGENLTVKDAIIILRRVVGLEESIFRLL